MGDTAAPAPRIAGRLWVALRLLTWGWLVLIAALFPEQLREAAIAAWPPSSPWLVWLERLLIAPFERRDVIYFLQIVANGYDRFNGTAQFHPLLAWLATPLHWLGLSPLLSLVIVSSGASWLLLRAFEQLAHRDLPADDARTATILFALSPFVFAIFVPYTEGLFLLFAVLCFLAMRERRWWLAGSAALCAVLTRQQGIFLILPLAWALWEDAHYDWRAPFRRWREWAALGLIPLGLLIWLLYRAVALNDLQANLSSPQTLIYSIIISPSAEQVVPNQAFLLPWRAFALAIEKLLREPEQNLIIDLAFALIFVVMAVVAWPRLRNPDRLYSLAMIAISFAYHTGPLFPYMGLPRHLLLAFPIWLGLAPALRHPALRLSASALSLLALFFLLLMYSWNAWVP